MVSRAESAHALMVEHRHNCAQIVFSAFAGDLGLDPATALKVAMCFGGGMARSGNTCGVVTGAYMVLGLSQDLTPDEPRAGLGKAYQIAAEFNRRFKELHGSLLCRELIGCDMSTAEGRQQAADRKVLATLCPGFVRDSVKIVEELIRTE